MGIFRKIAEKIRGFKIKNGVLIKYKGKKRKVIIPAGVTSIGDRAFWKCKSLKSIVIPKSVTSIGDSVFLGCSKLESIAVEQGNPIYHSEGNCIIETKSKTLIAGCKNSVIPDDGSVTSIGNSAFDGCSSLKSIVIPDSVTSIGDHAFDGCSKLESIAVEQGNPIYHSEGNCIIETKSKTLIAGCKNSVIPDDGSVTSIGNSAFDGCSSLTNITIPESVTNIDRWAFAWCSSLKSIVIPDSVTSIGDCAFAWCSSLKSIVIPDSVTSIGDSAFWECKSLKSIVIPDSVTSIGDHAFDGCSSLKSIVIPNSVTSIGEVAFWSCSSLTSIVIPDSVTSIGDWAFSDCKSLKTIKYIGTEEQWEAVKKGRYWNPENAQVICTGAYYGNAKSI